MFSLGNPGFSLENPRFPSRNPSFSWGNPSISLGKLMFALGFPRLSLVNHMFSLGNSSLSSGNPRFSLGNPCVSLENPKFPLRNPRFSLGSPSCSLGSLRFPKEILGFPHFYPQMHLHPHSYPLIRVPAHFSRQWRADSSWARNEVKAIALDLSNGLGTYDAHTCQIILHKQLWPDSPHLPDRATDERLRATLGNSYILLYIYTYYIHILIHEMANVNRVSAKVSTQREIH